MSAAAPGMPDPLAEVAESLQAARRARQAGPPPRTRGVSTLDQAYRVQELTYLSSSAPRHYKIGATSPALRAKFGADHSVLGMLAAPPRPSGSVLHRADFIAPLLEVEVAFVFGRSPDDPADADSVRAAVDHVRVAFEIADSATLGWDVELVDLVADNGCAAAAVLGDAQVAPAEFDSTEFTAVLEHEGTELARGGPAALVEGPWGTLAWLAATLPARGLGLDAGSVVLSGSCTPPTTWSAPGEYRARIEPLGDVVFVAS